MARQVEEELLAQAPQYPLSGEARQISVIPHYEEQIADKLANLGSQASSGLAAVRGQVTLLGNSLPGINVYANRVMGDQRSYYGRSEPGLWITSEEGAFSGTLPTGTYEFGIGLDYQQAKLVEGYHLQILNGELELQVEGAVQVVEFRFVEPVKLKEPTADLVYHGGPIAIEWAAYPGAHEYDISVSGVTVDSSGGTSYISATTGKRTGQTRFLYEGRSVSTFGVLGFDLEGVDPAYLIGRPEAYDRLKIVVRALDEDGNTLASSGGLHFGGDTPATGEVLVQGGLRNHAEQLLFDRRYDEAVKLLEEQIAEDPSDVDTLWILARIYFSGTHGRSEDAWRDGNFAHRDRKRSLAILEQIRVLEPGVEVEEAIEIVQYSLEGLRP
jgi:tetratricopeptide (TPR) repeat protein